jgi:hypothetical protein
MPEVPEHPPLVEPTNERTNILMHSRQFWMVVGKGDKEESVLSKIREACLQVGAFTIKNGDLTEHYVCFDRLALPGNIDEFKLD